MLQNIQGINMFVVEFDTIPELPITATTDSEAIYAIALQRAIVDGTITEGGKYGITVDLNTMTWTIYWIIE